MSLRHFIKKFKVDPVSLYESELLTTARKKMGKPLFQMAERVFTEYVEERNIYESGGYFKFAMVLGHQGQAPHKDVERLWSRMIEIYGDTEEADNFIKRILGTICMMRVASDPRDWVYRDDMEKKIKNASGETPEATEYWIAKV